MRLHRAPRERPETYRLRTMNDETYTLVLDALVRHNPIGLSYEECSQRTPEVLAVSTRLEGARSVAAVQRILFEEHVRWFDAAAAGSLWRYRPIAADIWRGLRGSNQAPTETSRAGASTLAVASGG